MANDGGLIALLEAWFASQLAALTFNSIAVFKTVDIWKHQVSAVAGGMEKFDGLAPFAFVSFQSTDAAREGDYDLRQVFEFAILIGTMSKEDGVARFGDANNLGFSKIRDLVIALFDRQHPGETIDCDEIYYIGDIEIFDSPRRYMAQMTFETSFMTV